MGVMNGDQIRDTILSAAAAATAIMALLRILGIADIPWLWVTAPIWGLIGLMFAGSALALLWLCVSALSGPKQE